jgi:methionyl-tRNA formyltransferase
MNKIKIAILTSGKSHHTFFVRELLKLYLNIDVYIEKKKIVCPFDNFHYFEEEREKFELIEFFENKIVNISDLTRCFYFDSINSELVLNELKNSRPDIVFVLGTGLIKYPLINLLNTMKIPLLNFHGGNPEKYRGLDSHLWSIYHKDFSELKVCLHEIDEDLDTGNIVSIEQIILSKEIKLYQLRKLNIELCINMAIETINFYSNFGKISSNTNSKNGRYYSFMPAVLKNICLNNFNEYISNL